MCPPQALCGQPSISRELSGLRFDISARAFFQTNAAQAAALTELVVSAAGAAAMQIVRVFHHCQVCVQQSLFQG